MSKKVRSKRHIINLISSQQNSNQSSDFSSINQKTVMAKQQDDDQNKNNSSNHFNGQQSDQLSYEEFLLDIKIDEKKMNQELFVPQNQNFCQNLQNSAMISEEEESFEIPKLPKNEEIKGQIIDEANQSHEKIKTIIDENSKGQILNIRNEQTKGKYQDTKHNQVKITKNIPKKQVDIKSEKNNNRSSENLEKKSTKDKIQVIKGLPQKNQKRQTRIQKARPINKSKIYKPNIATSKFQMSRGQHLKKQQKPETSRPKTQIIDFQKQKVEKLRQRQQNKIIDEKNKEQMQPEQGQSEQQKLQKQYKQQKKQSDLLKIKPYSHQPFIIKVKPTPFPYNVKNIIRTKLIKRPYNKAEISEKLEEEKQTKSKIKDIIYVTRLISGAIKQFTHQEMVSFNKDAMFNYFQQKIAWTSSQQKQN